MNIMVTGATGFLGRKLCMRLNSMNHNVWAIGRNLTIGNDLLSKGINFTPLDLRDKNKIIKTFKNMDMAVHTAALSSPWGRYEDFYSINVDGTENIILGCIKHQVKRLINISSPSIYLNHFRSRYKITENDPFAKRSPSFYSKTKLLAEQKVLAAFRDKQLNIVNLRPKGFFGPGDTTIFPRLINAYKMNRLKIIGQGNTMIDLTYIENIVDAIILSLSSPKRTLGESYNITNDQPINLWNFINTLLSKINFVPIKRNVPYLLAYSTAYLLENYYKFFKKYNEPPITRYGISILAKSQTFDISRAKSELGYIPKVNMRQGLDNFVAWWERRALETRS